MVPFVDCIFPYVIDMQLIRPVGFLAPIAPSTAMSLITDDCCLMSQVGVIWCVSSCFNLACPVSNHIVHAFLMLYICTISDLSWIATGSVLPLSISCFNWELTDK